MSDKHELHGEATPQGIVVLPEVVERFRRRLRVIVGADLAALSDGDLCAWVVALEAMDERLRAECMRRFPEYLAGDQPVN